MTRSPALFVSDIVTASKDILAFTQGQTYDQFVDDEKTLSAVIRKFEVVGEAAKNVSQDIQNRYPDIPWKAMAGMRDRLIHAYFGVDTVLVWDTVKNLIPDLLQSVNAVAESLQDE